MRISKKDQKDHSFCKLTSNEDRLGLYGYNVFENSKLQERQVLLKIIRKFKAKAVYETWHSKSLRIQPMMFVYVFFKNSKDRQAADELLYDRSRARI